MKKILLFLLILINCFLINGATYYISPTGNDATGNGSSANPWKTLYKACNSVTTAGDIISVSPGTYLAADNAQPVVLAVGVSVIGASSSTSIIECGNPGASQPFIRLETPNGWLGTYGNQSITNLTIDGNNVAYGCIRVNFRSNVKIRNLIVRDFTNYGIVFYGMPQSSWTTTSVFEANKKMPNYFCVGNELTNCTITNCTIGEAWGNLSIGQQNGIIIAYNTITQPLRGSGGNCGGIKFMDDGHNMYTDCHDNYISVVINPANLFNFALEMWYERGGCKYYNNTIEGTCDFDATVKGSSTYSVWFHHNNVGHSTFQTNASSSNFGVDIEASCSDMIIEKNYIHHVKNGIYFSHIWPNAEHSYDNIFNNIRISCNKFANIGMANGPSDWEPVYGIYCGREQVTAGTAQMNNIYILNNVIECTSVTPNSYYVIGIWLPQCDITVNNFQVRNNIIKGFIGGTAYSAPIFGTGLYGTLNDIKNLIITNNDFYGNGNNNNIQFVSGYSPSPYTNNSNITTNPNLDANYKINRSSPAYHTGTNVGLTDDYDNVSWNNPPSMGAHEFSEALPVIVKLIINGGNMIVNQSNNVTSNK